MVKAEQFVLGAMLIMGIILDIILWIKQAYFYAFLGLILVLVFLYLFMQTAGPREPLDIDKIVKAYIQFLSLKFNYDLEKNHTLLRVEELKNSYLIVITDMMQDGEVRYWPFECNKYELKFGRGTGTFQTDLGEIKNWVLSASKSQFSTMILDIMERKANAEINADILKASNGSRGGGDVFGNRQPEQRNE